MGSGIDRAQRRIPRRARSPVAGSLPHMTRRLLPALIALGLLAGCGGDASSDKRTATGEVLEGTISDDMLPLDTVKSQAPLADPGAARKATETAPATLAEGEAAAPAAPESAVTAAQPGPAAKLGPAPKPGFESVGGN